MSHCINAIVTKENAQITQFSKLKQGFVILRDNKFNRKFISQLNQPYVVVHTDYFGGAGTQSASFSYNKQHINFADSAKDGAINEALNLLGVKKISDMDLFDSIGLGYFRENDDIYTEE